MEKVPKTAKTVPSQAIGGMTREMAKASFPTQTALNTKAHSLMTNLMAKASCTTQTAPRTIMAFGVLA